MTNSLPTGSESGVLEGENLSFYLSEVLLRVAIQPEPNQTSGSSKSSRAALGLLLKPATWLPSSFHATATESCSRKAEHLCTAGISPFPGEQRILLQHMQPINIYREFIWINRKTIFKPSLKKDKCKQQESRTREGTKEPNLWLNYFYTKEAALVFFFWGREGCLLTMFICILERSKGEQALFLSAFSIQLPSKVGVALLLHDESLCSRWLSLNSLSLPMIGNPVGSLLLRSLNSQGLTINAC